ncbi:hypothetical protein CDL12_30092 [Handroanthus impetiginosus]|uniref:DUF632 domain-containing protein n=1 Tax=Handroanthus impetiginosus TaxID=429701 RepID=A0A2G9FWL0_9LAMI|nr:hypothetical protein CDL12_30092 [Handroanthus impetiginosus]
MGIINSKSERNNALNICRGRKRFIKQTIHSRNALAAAHVSYVQSLRSIGIALRRFAEAEVCVENSPSASAIELDKTPSHSSYPSLLTSRSGDVSDLSSINNSLLLSSNAIVSRMRSSGASALTITVSPPPMNVDVEEGEFSMPPPPPPPPELRSSWDYFDPHEESFRLMGQNGMNVGSDDARMYGSFGKNDDVLGGLHERTVINEHGELVLNNGKVKVSGKEVNGSNWSKNASFVEKDACKEREDAPEIISHIAKDFVSSIKDIDNSFVRASESGKEVSRMLESSKIRSGYAEAKGTPRASTYLALFGASCFQGGAADVSDDQNVTKVITWKRTTSTRSSSYKNHTRDESDKNVSDFIDEFCMISGSHSSTLDRLYAWERKLYDEVKASKSIQKEYDRKSGQLRYQFAKDLSPQTIDKTRAVLRDLYSRIRVALHAVDSVSKRIEKMRDEELLPQLLELIQGLTKMWKTMFECHHSQYITISLSYHAKGPAISFHGETQRQITTLLDELEYFGLSFANLINSYTSFVESLNSWLQICILPPCERHKGRRAFSPRRHLAPQIFVLCRDWSAGIKLLPSDEVSYAIKCLIWELRRIGRTQQDKLLRKEPESNEDRRSSNIRCVQDSLMRVFDKLSKFSEASVKTCEDVLMKCDAARNAYESYRVQPRTFCT